MKLTVPNKPLSLHPLLLILNRLPFENEQVVTFFEKNSASTILAIRVIRVQKVLTNKTETPVRTGFKKGKHHL
ncbi:MAG: hypothetical protein Fur0016_00370 [Anaerolineales bacterium]